MGNSFRATATMMRALLVFAALLPALGQSGRTRVFFDVDVDGSPLGRVEFELYNEVVPRTAKTSGLCALGRKALATRAPSSIELSQNSCSREEISREAMALGASPSTETNSMTKTLQRSTIRLVSCPWPTLARTQTALSSSSRLASPPG